MRRIIAVLLLCAPVFAQTTAKPGKPSSSTSAPANPAAQTSKPAGQKSTAATPPATPGAESKSPTTQVAENAPVITLNGACATPDAKGQCNTVITRKQFEDLVSVVNPQTGFNPPLTNDAKRRIATSYARFLAFSDQAKKEGLDKTPEAGKMKEFAAMQAMAQLYINDLQSKTKPTEAEVEKFYNDNKTRYEKINVRRILVPASGGFGAKDVTPEKMKETAQKIYDRAKAGEDFDTLEKDALAAAGQNTSYETKLTLNPTALPQTQQSVKELKPGEVSQLFAEPSGYYIYKMEGSETTPFAQVKPQIEQELHQKKFQEALQGQMEKIKPDFNEAYFGPAPARGRAPGEPD
jgi:parvulin-like peptidyl-prolyl isomerase